MDEGAGVVPVYAFNENQVGIMLNYDYILFRLLFVLRLFQWTRALEALKIISSVQLFKHDPRFLLDFWQWVNNYVKIGVPFMRGYFNLPMPYSK